MDNEELIEKILAETGVGLTVEDRLRKAIPIIRKAERKRIGNRLNEPCPNNGEEIYKCPRCVRQLRDELLRGKLHKQGRMPDEVTRNTAAKEMKDD